MTNQIHETVREHYAKSALQVIDQGTQASCCGDGCCNGVSCTDPNHATEHLIDPGAITFYSDAERAALPDQAVLAALGCGNPLAVADLLPGERVLDLGSGGGIDVLLSAQRVGPEGRAIGLDMTDEMLALARANAQAANATNVEFLKGHIEAIPLPADSIDVVHLELRGQPRRRQAGRVRGDRPRPAARWPDRDHRHRGRRRPDP